jgi:hypothetical protein
MKVLMVAHDAMQVLMSAMRSPPDAIVLGVEPDAPFEVLRSTLGQTQAAVLDGEA